MQQSKPGLNQGGGPTTVVSRAGGDGFGPKKSLPNTVNSSARQSIASKASKHPNNAKRDSLESHQTIKSSKAREGDGTKERKDSQAQGPPQDLYEVNSDELMNIFNAEKVVEKGPRLIRRATGYEILDQFRMGPDIIDEGMEVTPLPHWMGKQPIQSYSNLVSKTSDELIPVTPKPTVDYTGTTFDIRMYQHQTKSPAMSWNASLTTLEEEEFEAEVQLHETHKLVHNLIMEDEVEKVYTENIAKVTYPDGTVLEKRRFRVILSECPTTFLFEITGKHELENTAVFETINVNNKRYKTMCQHHLESDAYSNRFAQTFENRSRDQWTEYKSPAAFDVGVQANFYLIEDEYEAVNEMDAKRKIKEEEEAQMRILQERMKLERDANDDLKNSDEDDSDDEDKLAVYTYIDWAKYGGKYEEEDDEDEQAQYKDINEKEFEMSDNEEEFDTLVPLEDIYERQLKKQEEATLTVLPDITNGVMYLDRLVSMEYNQDNQADMRGFPVLNANRDDDKKDAKPHFFSLLEENRNQKQLDLGPNIKRYWALKSNVTKGREVTDIALHPMNGNIVAASYGSNKFGDDEEGMVCVWSAKNTLYPERIYEFKSSVTCLCFATLTPYLLAIGMLDGNLAVYDVRSSQPLALSSTIGSQDKHEGPIWQLCWFQEQEMATQGSVNEILLSLGDDGKLNRWTSTKGFDSVTMLRIRRSALKIPGRREKRAEALTSNLSGAYSMCFYPGDWTQYLIGTEEGFIHKCSTSFTEQFLGTYIGHSGPIYRITFNSFDHTIFVSASGDWSVKVWKEGTFAPLLSMQTGLRTMFDVTTCPRMSSVFVCASEFHVEVWDLTINTLEPVVIFTPPFAVAFKRAAYSSYLNSVILGDDEGAITFYGLRDFPNQPITAQEQVDQLLEGLIPGYRKRLKEAAQEAQYHQNILNEQDSNYALETQRLSAPEGNKQSVDATGVKSKSVSSTNLAAGITKQLT